MKCVVGDRVWFCSYSVCSWVKCGCGSGLCSWCRLGGSVVLVVFGVMMIRFVLCVSCCSMLMLLYCICIGKLVGVVKFSVWVRGVSSLGVIEIVFRLYCVSIVGFGLLCCCVVGWLMW